MDMCVETLYCRLADLHDKTLAMAIADEAIHDATMLSALWHLVDGADNPVRWRAAWALEKVSEQCPSLLMDKRHRLMELVMQHDMPKGLCRLLLSILYHLPSEEKLDVPFFNFILDMMADFRMPPGVQALAMKLAAGMSMEHKELFTEFLCVVRHMESSCYSAGVRAVIRRFSQLPLPYRE